MEDENRSTIADIVKLRKEKADPRDLESTKYVGLEHLESGGGLSGYGDSSGLKSSKSVFKKGDILYGKLRPYLNKHAFAPFDGISSTDILVFQSPKECTSKLFNYYLGSRAFINQAHAESKGISLPRVSAKSILKFPLKFPEEIEQEKIVSILDRYTGRQDKIEGSLSRLPGLLSDFRESVLRKAVTGVLIGKDFFSDYNPVSLGSVCEKPRYGTSTKSNSEGDVPVLRMGNLQEGEINWEKLKFTSDPVEVEKYNLIEGDILFNRTNSPELVGKTSIYRGGQQAIHAGYLIKVRVDRKKVRPDFLNYVLNSSYAKAWAWEVKTDGVSQSNINASKLSDFMFSLPSLGEQDQVIEKANALLGIRHDLLNQLGSLERQVQDLPQAVLGRAFRGGL